MNTRYTPFGVKQTILLFSILCILTSLKAEPFPTPDIIKENVAFWKKIYTEVSLKDGLLHDRDYPLIIYKRITVNTEARVHRKRIIKNEKAKVEAILGRIQSMPKDKWSAQEKAIAKLYTSRGLEHKIASASNRIRFQRGQKDRFKEGLYRSGAYLDTISSILRHYNLPQELRFLPHVESSFLTSAYSKVGAAGLWQFMRSTGKSYMTINYSIDERRDPILSTYAAAKLLSHNYSQLKSWPLAITAYNHGLYGMKRAVAQVGSNDIGVIIQKHKSRMFKFASKNFYSCFLAASEIAENPKHYFPDITFAPRLRYTSFTLDYFVKPSTLVSYLGVSKKKLRELNPGIRPVVFRQDKLIPKGVTVQIPITFSQTKITAGLTSIPDSLKVVTPPKPNYYRVRRGDNLYAIARRLGVSARSLALENNITRMNRIYAGQVLRVPGAPKEVTPKVIAAKKKKPVKKIVKKEKPATKEKVVVAPPKKETVVAEKKEKASSTDTLQDIIMTYADAEPQTTTPRVQNSYKFDASIYALDVNQGPKTDRARIRITVDETLGHYAEWLDIATQRIRSINGMGRSSTIRINQKLLIPGSKSDLDQFIQRRLEYHMALEEDFYSQYKVTGLRPKKVERGETLWQICNSDGEVPLWLLKKYNRHIDIGQLYPNTQLWLPIIEEKSDKDLQQESNGIWRGIYPAYRELDLRERLSRFTP